MIELKTREQLKNAIKNAQAESKNLVVRLTRAVRMYRVENRRTNNTYTVNFFIRNDRRFASCTCPAHDKGYLCKHIAAAAALNTYLATQGAFNTEQLQPAVSQVR